MTSTADSQPVLAAGVVVLRRDGDGAPEVLVVHRPHHSDWSLPKGKLDPGEYIVATAVRECSEETGINARLAAPLPSQQYIALGRPKLVHYWAARIAGDEGFSPDEEIDEIRWLPIAAAKELLTYPHDGALVDAALELPETSPLIVLRHTKAMKRSDYRGKLDADRPLSGRGRSNAKSLIALLEAYGIANVHSSDSARCVTTVKPYAKAIGTGVFPESSLSEEAHADNPKRAAKRIRALVTDPSSIVVCSHRPVLPTILDTIAEELGIEADRELLDPKLPPGGFIVIHREFTADGVRPVAIELHSEPYSEHEPLD